MTGHRFFCQPCEVEFHDPAPLADNGWLAADCPKCGETVVMRCQPVPCPACGIEFSFISIGGEGEPTAKCPTCGATVAVASPETTPQAESPRERRPESAGRRRTSPPHTGAVIAALVAVIYVIACFLPTVRLERGDPYIPGYVCMLLGWITCFFWFPNPLLWAGCVALATRRNRRAFVLGVLACLFTLPLFVGFDTPFMRSDFSWGFYVWQGDIVFFTVSAGILFATRRA